MELRPDSNRPLRPFFVVFPPLLALIVVTAVVGHRLQIHAIQKHTANHISQLQESESLLLTGGIDSLRRSVGLRSLIVASAATVAACAASLVYAFRRSRRVPSEVRLADDAAIFRRNPSPVFRIDRRGRVLKMNAIAQKVIGQPVDDHSFLAEIDLEAILRHDGAEPFQFEQTIAGRSYLFSVQPEKEEATFLLYGSDITGIRDIEREMRKLSTAVEQSATAILITDLHGKITFANDACERTSGYLVEELLGRNTRIFRSGRQDREKYDDLWQTIRRGEVWHGELENRRKNGEIYWEETSITPLRPESSRISGYLAVKEDITQKKDTEKELRAAKEEAEDANRMKSEFLANMSHEIRTPMNAILGFTDVLLEDEIDVDKRRNLNVVKQSGTHLLALISDILDFSKIEAGKVDIEANIFAVR